MLYRDLNVELPGPTQILIALTVDYRVRGAWALFALVFVGRFWHVFCGRRTEEGGAAFDRMKFRIPVIGDTLLKFQVAQFSRTLATLLTGGTPLVRACKPPPTAISSKLIRVDRNAGDANGSRRRIAAAALWRRKGRCRELALDMIEVGESSGALAPMLTSVAEFYEEEVNVRLAALVAVIEPVILIFHGTVVAFILISLYLPIFSFSLTNAAPR